MPLDSNKLPEPGPSTAQRKLYSAIVGLLEQGDFRLLLAQREMEALYALSKPMLNPRTVAETDLRIKVAIWQEASNYEASLRDFVVGIEEALKATTDEPREPEPKTTD